MQFYFQYAVRENEDPRTLALVSSYSDPDIELLKASSNTLWSCQYRGKEALSVIDVKVIKSVVAMVPHSTAFLGDSWSNRVFVAEKPGLDVAEMGGVVEEAEDDESSD